MKLTYMPIWLAEYTDRATRWDAMPLLIYLFIYFSSLTTQIYYLIVLQVRSPNQFSLGWNKDVGRAVFCSGGSIGGSSSWFIQVASWSGKPEILVFSLNVNWRFLEATCIPWLMVPLSSKLATMGRSPSHTAFFF